MITYTEEKKFDNKSVVDLFSSVGWVSAQYPTRLYKALMHSSTVITAWDGDRLIGLVRVLDDSELVAYIHYVLVHPDWLHICIMYWFIRIIMGRESLEPW